MQQYGQEGGSVPLWEPMYTEDTTAVVGVSPQRVKRVHLRLFDGSETTIDVPANSYNAQTVQRMADEIANAHMEVINLRGAPVQRPQ